MTQSRLYLLGGFRLTTGRGQTIEVAAKKNRALLAILALAPRHETTRDRLTGLLWSDRGEEQARSSLRQALVALRKDLSGLEADPLLLNGDRVGLAPELLIIDVSEFLAEAASSASDGLQRAAELYAGPLLDGLNVADNSFDDWLREARSDLSSQAIKVMAALAETLAGADRVTVSEKLVALDPLREASHAVLMQAHIAQGQTALAIRRYETCKQILKRELNVEPGTGLRELRRSLDTEGTNPGISIQRDRKPVIAVLPFENLSGDPGQQHFSDGITQDIIDRLSKYRILSVIGQPLVVALHSTQGELQEFSERLAADYVLTGSVRNSAGRIRIASRLTDARTLGAVWADHYDRVLQDVFAVQDEVAALIASTLRGRVEIEVSRRSAAVGPGSTSSYEYLLQGVGHFKKVTVADNAIAADFFEKAVAAYPQNAEAHRGLACTQNSLWFFDFDREAINKSRETAARAVALDPSSATCHAVLGFCQLWTEGVQAAGKSYRRALAHNPDDPDVLIEMALCQVYSGDLFTANTMLAQAFRLNPLPPLWYAEFRGIAEFVEGRYADALPAFLAVPDGAWDTMYAMACMGHLENREQAAACKAEFLKAGRNWNFLEAAKSEPYTNPEHRENLIRGLEKALAF